MTSSAKRPAPLLVPHEAPLWGATLLRRRDRFLADARLDNGEEVVAHCVNPGAMEGLVVPGSRIWLLPAPPHNKKRKLRWTWELSEDEDGLLIGANTGRPNQLVAAALEARWLSPFRRWTELQSERKYGERSRIDFWMKLRGREHFLEVKNCHLVYPDRCGYFPDSVSARAAKHLEELSLVSERGDDASVLFIVQRGDARRVRPSALHDPTFFEAARAASKAGVRFFALRVQPRLDGYLLERRIPVDLEAYDTSEHLKWRETRRLTSGWQRSPRKNKKEKK